MKAKICDAEKGSQDGGPKSTADSLGTHMETPLNASANSAGSVFANWSFDVPQFQREYSWSANDEVQEFWSDLRNNLGSDVYFLGLVILTDDIQRKHVVDGQQRIITLSLLAAALYHEALARGREALADRIAATFLKSMNYETDATEPRVRLSDQIDDATFQTIIDKGEAPSVLFGGDSVSRKIVESYNLVRNELKRDLKTDPFKRLGVWAEFLTHKLYFAVFVHPDPAAAYQVYEVINTRGKELTTADLLKNYILSQTAPHLRQQRYEEWQVLAGQFAAEGTNNFVQYIRHVITVEDGHILPKDLYAFLAGRLRNQVEAPHTTDDLMRLFEENLRLYLQMIDPSLAGPASEPMLSIFAALNNLGVLVVRPMLLAIADTPNPELGMRRVLELVVRRIVVGSLGTGNVERRLGEAAQKIKASGDWEAGLRNLKDLNPSREDFEGQLKKRSYNKSTLTFLRRSIVQNSQTPVQRGNLHFICPRNAEDWGGMAEEDRAFWYSTIGNTLLSDLARRLPDSTDWEGFKEHMLPTAIDGELSDYIDKFASWDSDALAAAGDGLAGLAGDVWF